MRALATSYKVTYTRGTAPVETVADLVYTQKTAAAIAAGQVLMLDFSASGNAAVTRATVDGLAFPAAASGTLTFDVDLPLGLAAGSTVKGHFGVFFTSGDTLSGTFSAPLSRATP